jgi:LPXTG-motif cell wall-anchored protein
MKRSRVFRLLAIGGLSALLVLGVVVPATTAFAGVTYSGGGEGTDVDNTAPEPVDPSAFHGVKVTDKNAQMSIPVLFEDTAKQQPGVSAVGVLDGANIHVGDEVYIRQSIGGLWKPGDGTCTFSESYVLVVNGKVVTSDFGTIKLTRPTFILMQDPQDVALDDLLDGKTREITIDTTNGSSSYKSTCTNRDETFTVTMTRYNSEADPFKVLVDYSTPIDDGSQSDGSASQQPSIAAPAVSGDTGIKASGTLSGSSIPEGANVAINAVELQPGNADYDKLASAMGDAKISGVYDVSMLVNGTEVHNGFGDLVLSMPVDPAYNGHWVTVWHLHDDGSITTERHVAKDGVVTFTVSDLSSFGLEIGEVADSGATVTPTSDRLPQTGDPTAALGLLAACGVTLAGLGAFAGRRKDCQR